MLSRRSAKQKALLRELQLLLAVGTTSIYGHQRHSRLQDEGGHDLVNGLTGSPRLSQPEIGRRGIAVGMRLQISVHAFAKNLRPQIGLKHAQYSSAFFISDAVKHLFD